jgi:hypothetical protein
MGAINLFSVELKPDAVLLIQINTWPVKNASFASGKAATQERALM